MSVWSFRHRLLHARASRNNLDGNSLFDRPSVAHREQCAHYTWRTIRDVRNALATSFSPSLSSTSHRVRLRNCLTKFSDFCSSEPCSPRMDFCQVEHRRDPNPSDNARVTNWDERYRQGEHTNDQPHPLITRFASKLAPGRALDLASGPGRHAIWLAERGWQVTAVED